MRFFVFELFSKMYYLKLYSDSLLWSDYVGIFLRKINMVVGVYFGYVEIFCFF